ncbi:MAG: V-type ATP synthase subunit I [Spirochaetota bacterium]
MKKATILVLDSRRREELANLKRLGLLHPEIERRSDEKTEKLSAERELVERALAELPSEDEAEAAGVPAARPATEMDASVADVDGFAPGETLEDALESARSIHNAAEHRRGRREVLDKIDAELERVRPWGEFDPDDVRELAEREISVHLYSMSPKDFRKNAPEDALVLESGPRAVRFALVWYRGSHPSGNTPEEIAATPGVTEFRLPEISPEELRKRREEEIAEISAVEQELMTLAPRRRSLEAALAELERRLRDEHVRLGMDTAERVAYITGYIPADSVDSLKQAASNNGWGTLIRDPGPEDQVPTKIRNRGPIRLIRPVFDFLGVVPGYHERDISFFFLLFFIVFVGMIIGDAGYGSLLLIASVMMIARSRGEASERRLFPALLTVLSVSTIAWGAATGNWFGYEPIGEAFPFSLVAVPELDAFDAGSNETVQRVGFMLAVVHLSIAHLWNFVREVRQRPAMKAVAQVGWLSMVIGLYLLVVSLFLGTPFPSYGLYMIGGGLLAVIVFGSQSAESGFLGGIGKGFANLFITFIDTIGGFSDVVSYIRLFAVGLATVQIAQAFNAMAQGVAGGLIGTIGATVILLFGHTLNVVMAGLAVIVHGVRLNLLEFSGHLGMEWSGVEYKPYT